MLLPESAGQRLFRVFFTSFFCGIADTLTEGGALEQSLGGVETLFKGNADTVKAYAQNAWQTAGLSANA